MAQLDSITQREAVAGLKAALERGSEQAVATLGRADGFLGNPQVKIPLPDSLTRAERLMRRVGAGRYADEVIVAMNRAAEQAVPEARQILVGAVKQMSVQDAKGILTGGDTAGTCSPCNPIDAATTGAPAGNGQAFSVFYLAVLLSTP